MPDNSTHMYDDDYIEPPTEPFSSFHANPPGEPIPLPPHLQHRITQIKERAAHLGFTLDDAIDQAIDNAKNATITPQEPPYAPTTTLEVQRDHRTVWAFLTGALIGAALARRMSR